RFEAHVDCRTSGDKQHHFPPTLLNCLGAVNQRAYADRGKETDGGQVDHHAFFRRCNQLDEPRGYRVGARHIETAGDHDAAKVFADVVIADGHDVSLLRIVILKHVSAHADGAADFRWSQALEGVGICKVQ